MPRYMVERTFPDGLRIQTTEEGAATCLGVVGRNSEAGVPWVHAHVSDGKRKTYCSTAARTRRPYVRRPSATACPWTASRRSAFWIPTSTGRTDA
jgi:hypothetical protein